MEKIDARGLECPQPVLKIKKALEEALEASILVDNEAARENVRRFGENNGCKVTIVENDQGTELFLKKTRDEAEREGNAKASADDGVVVLIKSARFGEGDPKLGALLMKSFLVSLLESDRTIKGMIFMNSGVELTTREGEPLEILEKIAGKGAALYSCGTCLDFYGLKEDLKIGEVTNMYSAVELLTEAGSKALAV